jgi:glycosyltransferase involved in cell wall biosynthesis
MVDARHVTPSGPSILIIGDFGFPYGTGASSRVFSYATGLQAAGAHVKVLCVEPSGWAGKYGNTAARGEYRGVVYEYTYGRTTRPAARWLRGWLKATKPLRFVASGRRWASERGGLDMVLVYSRSMLWLVAARVLCSMTGALLVHEDCELPFVGQADGILLRLRRRAYERLVFRLFDGCIAISSLLEDYCGRYLRPGAGVLLVPILVDVLAFDADAGSLSGDGDAVVYCGYATHPEVLDLVKGFAIVAEANPGLRLQVIGGSLRPHLLPKLWELARELGVADRLELVGMVKRDELPQRLRAARVLVLPRPDAPFSRAGLPTKLGEYLAAGRPVVVSSVGDIPSYLRDGVDAYLCAPGDVPGFAARLAHVLDHPVEAAEVGLRGRETAVARFDPVVHGRRIIEFADGLRPARDGVPES